MAKGRKKGECVKTYIARPDGTIWNQTKYKCTRLNPSKHYKKDYLQFDMYVDGKRVNKQVHRFIAEQLIPNPDNLPVVDHINRNRLDNRVENLRWSTREDNWYNFELSIEKCIDTLTRAGYKVISPK
jgi:hypothetical protein